ncbi:SubName: Full=Related to Agaricus bisporus lectin-Agaricus bisporus {ECO:0000313/EMBL:CCA74595.1} [Serendipita indica DSM 11827]|nr:SubName: Full=Related to Agaricus bisporus lectin-Agaricus bisporus {ECO:0000313/EMBL:CCA74595.1} [Serendipita indica DSM 11827]
MTYSGSCGSLRFESDTGEHVIALFGVHEYKRWCDIVTLLPATDTTCKLLPQWYVDGTNRQKPEQPSAPRTPSLPRMLAPADTASNIPLLTEITSSPTHLWLLTVVPERV